MRAESFSADASEDASWTYADSGNGAGRLIGETRANGYVRAIAYNALGEAVSDTQTYAGTGSVKYLSHFWLGGVPIHESDQAAACSGFCSSSRCIFSSGSMFK